MKESSQVPSAHTSMPEALLAAGWSPNSLLGALKEDNEDNQKSSENKSSQISFNDSNKENDYYVDNLSQKFNSNKEIRDEKDERDSQRRLMEAGWSLDALLCAMSSPSTPSDNQKKEKKQALKTPDNNFNNSLINLNKNKQNGRRCRPEEEGRDKQGTPLSPAKKCVVINKNTPNFENNKNNENAEGAVIFDLSEDSPEKNQDTHIISMDALSNQLSRSQISSQVKDCADRLSAKTITGDDWTSSKFSTAKKLFHAQGHTFPKHSASVASQRKAYSHEKNVEEVLDSPLPNGWKLFAHQKDAIRQCLMHERSILALDMGLGKTIISVMWAKLMCSKFNNCNCVTIVVAPCTLLDIWRKESEMMGFCCIGNAGSSGSGFNCMADATSGSRPLLLQSSWAKIPTPNEVSDAVVRHNRRHKIKTTSIKFVIICDEAHAMQTLQSQRTQAALLLCRHKSCVGAILATGTPMKNGRPANLLPLLTAIRHPLASNKVTYEKRYCDAKKTKFCPWDTSGASNLSELQERLNGKLIRKTKEECLDLPKLSRRRVLMPILPETQREYQAIIHKFKELSKQKGRTNDRHNSSGLEMVSALRQLSSTAKVAFTESIIRKLLQDDGQSPIVVFVWYRETAKLLASALHERPPFEVKCGVITGDVTKQMDRQATVDAFQAGELDVVICSYGVGSTGLTLTRSHTIILLDRPWTPGDARQAEDRVRRIGQTSSSIRSIWIAGFSIDDSLDKLLQKKDKNSEVAISGDPSLSPSQWFEDSERAETKPKSGSSSVSGKQMSMDHFLGREEKDLQSNPSSTSKLAKSSSPFVWSSTDRCQDDENYDSSLGSANPSSTIMKTIFSELIK